MYTATETAVVGESVNRCTQCEDKDEEIRNLKSTTDLERKINVKCADISLLLNQTLH